MRTRRIAAAHPYDRDRLLFTRLPVAPTPTRLAQVNSGPTEIFAKLLIARRQGRLPFICGYHTLRNSEFAVEDLENLVVGGSVELVIHLDITVFTVPYPQGRE